MAVMRQRIVTCTLLCLILGGAWHAQTAAQPAALVAIAPAVVEIAPGETALLRVTIDGAVDLYGYEIELAFDPARVQLLDGDLDTEGVQLRPGDWFEGQPSFAAANRVDNARGMALYAATLLAPAPPRSGQGVLVTFEVRGQNEGSSELLLASVAISSIDGVLIPVNTAQGEIVVRDGAAAPTPMSLPTSTGTPRAQATQTPQSAETSAPSRVPDAEETPTPQADEAPAASRTADLEDTPAPQVAETPAPSRTPDARETPPQTDGTSAATGAADAEDTRTPQVGETSVSTGAAPTPSPTAVQTLPAPGRSILRDGVWLMAPVVLIGLSVLLFIRRVSRRRRQS
jgi:general secretion pathway protein D